MRYRIGEVASENAYANSVHFVELTVYVTLLIGVGFLIAGYRGRQSWLKIWGGLTIFACAAFFVAQYLGLFSQLS